MYCAYPVPGMGSNSLMYYYNGKSVSSLFGNVCVCVWETQRWAVRSVCFLLSVGLPAFLSTPKFCVLVVSGENTGFNVWMLVHRATPADFPWHQFHCFCVITIQWVWVCKKCFKLYVGPIRLYSSGQVSHAQNEAFLASLEYILLAGSFSSKTWLK